MPRVARSAVILVAIALGGACTGQPVAETTVTTGAPATTGTTLPAPPTTDTLPAATTTLPPPPPLQGDAWPELPVLDVAAAAEGDLLLAGPEGILLVRRGEPLGRLADEPVQVAVPDGVGGVVFETPFLLDGGGSNNAWWLPGTGGREYVGLEYTSFGRFRLQQVEWIPRLGRYEDGAWTPTYNGLTALFSRSDQGSTGVLVTTRDPLWVPEHWESSLPVSRSFAALTWTGRHLVQAVYGSQGSRLEFRRVDGTLDVLPHNPRPDFAPGWIGNLDAEPGSPLLAYTTSATRQQFGVDTTLHVVDLSDGSEVLSMPIAGPDQEVVRLDLHQGAVAVSTLGRLPGGVSMEPARIVDLATGTTASLPWGGTASFFSIAAPRPVAAYPTTPTDVPELVVSAPIEGTAVAAREVRFEGYATPGARVTAADRYPVPVDGQGRWSTTLVLNQGGNLAVFSASLAAGPPAETARVVFRTADPELGYSLTLRYERGDRPAWVATVWVYDRVSERRLPGARVGLALGPDWPQEPPVDLVTDDLGVAALRVPLTTGSAMACLMDLEADGYPPPPRHPYSDLPEGSIACAWASFP